MTRGDFPDDTFTENDVLNALSQAGLRYKNQRRYILSQCPTHDDEHPSVQIYKDDWFVNCHASCGRYHITKAFPHLRPATNGYQPREISPRQQIQPKAQEKKVSYKQFDQMEYWKSLPLIPRDHEFKTIPLDILDELGWRWLADKNSYYIPYFSRSKTTIPFSQMRHLQGDRRFTFLKDAKPTCYGTWNLEPGEKLFVVEGTSDCAVLDYCAIPWIGLPSSSSGELLKAMAGWCSENNVELVYAGDNDAAGDKLREALDEVISYRVKQPPAPYKDWGDFLVGEGIKVVINYAHEELFPGDAPPFPEAVPGWDEMNGVDKVKTIFPGAQELEIVNDPEPESKEQSAGSPQVLF